MYYVVAEEAILRPAYVKNMVARAINGINRKRTIEGQVVNSLKVINRTNLSHNEYVDPLIIGA